MKRLLIIFSLFVITKGFYLPRELFEIPLPKSPEDSIETNPRPQLQIVDVPEVIVQPYWRKGEEADDLENFANAKIVNGKLLFYMNKLISQMSPIFTSRAWLNLKLEDKKSPFVRI